MKTTFKIIIIIGILSIFVITTNESYSSSLTILPTSTCTVTNCNPTWGDSIWWDGKLDIKNNSSKAMTIDYVDWYLYDYDGSNKDLIKTETTNVGITISGGASTTINKGNTSVSAGEIQLGFDSSGEHKDEDYTYDKDLKEWILHKDSTLELCPPYYEIHWHDDDGSYITKAAEPATMMLLGLGLMVLARVRRRFSN